LTQIRPFRKGERLTPGRLNELVEAADRVLALRGDGLVEVSQAAQGRTLRLNVDKLLPRILPRSSGDSE